MSNNNGIPENIQYPFTNVQIAPDGILIQVYFSPTIIHSMVLDSATCDNVVKLWVQQKKQSLDMLEVARHIKQERLA